MDRLIKPDKTTGRPSKPSPDTTDETAEPKQLSETLTLTPDTHATAADTAGDTEVDTGNLVSLSPDMEADTVHTAADTESALDTGLNVADTRTHTDINTPDTETDTHISVADTRVGANDTEPDTPVTHADTHVGADMTVGQPDAVGVSILEDAHA